MNVQQTSAILELKQYASGGILACDNVIEGNFTPETKLMAKAKRQTFQRVLELVNEIMAEAKRA